MSRDQLEGSFPPTTAQYIHPSNNSLSLSLALSISLICLYKNGSQCCSKPQLKTKKLNRLKKWREREREMDESKKKVSERDEEKWVYDSSLDYKGRIPLRASTGAWKASFFIIGMYASFHF